MLHLSESDANCSRSTKYLSKLVKDFLEEPIEKNNDFEVVCLPPHADFIRGVFLHGGSLNATVEIIFLLGIKILFATKVKRCTFSNASIF